MLVHPVLDVVLLGPHYEAILSGGGSSPAAQKPEGRFIASEGRMQKSERG